VKALVSSIVSGVLAGASAGSKGHKGHYGYNNYGYNGNNQYGQNGYNRNNGNRDAYQSSTTYGGYHYGYKPVSNFSFTHTRTILNLRYYKLNLCSFNHKTNLKHIKVRSPILFLFIFMRECIFSNFV